MIIRYLKMHLSRFHMSISNEIYTGCHKYVPIEQRLNFRANRGWNHGGCSGVSASKEDVSRPDKAM